MDVTTTPSRMATKSTMGTTATASSGLKRPTTAATPMTSRTKADTKTPATPTPVKTRPGGLRPPSDVKKIDLQSKLKDSVKDKLVQGVQSKMQTASKRSSVAMPPGPVSAATDELDDIYKEEDPIEVQIGNRKKAGAITNQVPDKNSKSGKYFFTLKIKGE